MKKVIIIAIVAILGVLGYFLISSGKHQQNLTDQQIIERLDTVLKRVDDFFVSADEIDKYKIPSYVVGCSGRANLFAKYAKEAGIKDIYIVVSVYMPDIGKQHMNGHQIVAVKMSNGLQLLDPANGAYNFNRAKINGKCELNEMIDATHQGTKEYQIAAIMTQEEHEKLTSVEKLMEVYNRVSKTSK